MAKRISGVMPPIERAERMIELAIRMIELLRQENTMLENRQYRELSDTVSEKSVLMSNYELHLAYVGQNPDFPLSLDTDLFSDLIDATQLLEETALDNRQRLEQAIDAGEMVLDLVAAAAQRHQSEIAGYNAQGSVNQKNQAGTPVTLDRRL